MTTNVYDGLSFTLATDARWSLSLGYALLYVDDTGFEKIDFTDRIAYMFAGDSDVIAKWKNWIRSPGSSVRTRPALGRIAICMVDIGSGEVVFDRGQLIVKGNTRFAGTGATPAHQCWSENGCAKKAVETAKSADVYSGGTVKFFETLTKTHNLAQDSAYEQVIECFKQRGKYMLLQQPNGNGVSASAAASNDAEIKDMADKIASGQVTLTAPCPSIENDWTNDEVSALDAALMKYYPA